MLKLQVVHNQLNKASQCFFFGHTHTHTLEGEEEREREREKPSQYRETEQQKEVGFFSSNVEGGKKEKETSFICCQNICSGIKHMDATGKVRAGIH